MPQLRDNLIIPPDVMGSYRHEVIRQNTVINSYIVLSQILQTQLKLKESS